jgi:asparagine synthase (glutamine-hydrolysing)
MLCGAWSRSPDQWRGRMESAAGSPDQPPRVWQDGPLIVFADAAAQASQDVLVCHLEGRLSPEAGPPGARERRAATDADIVVGAFSDAGASGVVGLRGQFSAVVWDREGARLHLVCDRLARQGWYVLERPGEILFATELRDLLALAPSRPGADALSFSMWLGALGCPDGRTLYAGVSRLGPGESFAYSGGGLDRRVHWRPTYEPPQHTGRGELAEALRGQLRASTWQYLSRGVNGVILSGGIDSSVVAVAAAEGQASGIDVRTYSAAFPGAPYDESDKIRSLTGALGVRAHAIQPAPVGALWLALRYLQEWAVPLVAPGALLDMSVTQSAGADGAGIVLDGQTGDEVLGFSPFLLADRLAQGRLLAVRRLLRAWPTSSRPTSLRQRVRLARMFAVKGAAPYRLGRAIRDRRDRTDHGPKWLVPEHRRAVLEFEDAWAWKRRGAGPRWWRSFTDGVVWGPHRELRLEYLRHRAASAGMRWGSPLYDEELIDFCSRLDPEIAFNPKVNRPLVREAMSDVLPDIVRLQTRKANFSAFVVAAMRADTAGLQQLLSARDPEIAAYVDLNWLRQRWGREPHPEPMSPFWGALWRAAIGQAWLRFGADPAGLAEFIGDPAIAPTRADIVNLTQV